MVALTEVSQAGQHLVGHPFHEEWLPAVSLKRPTYQRPLDAKFVRKVAREFDPDRLHPLSVSRRADGDYVMDGGHRLAAILDVLGWRDQNVPCVVYEGLTYAQEVHFYTSQAPGFRRATSALDTLRADYDLREPYAVEIVALIEANGVSVDWDNSGSPGAVRAAGAVVDIYRTYGTGTLSAVIRDLRAAFGTEDRRTFNSEWLRAMAAFYIRYRAHPHFDPSELARKLRKEGLDLVRQRAVKLQGLEGGALHDACARAIWQTYNLDKRTRALPTWQARYMPEDVAVRRDERLSASNRANFTQGIRKPSGAAAKRRAD